MSERRFEMGILANPDRKVGGCELPGLRTRRPCGRGSPQRTSRNHFMPPADKQGRLIWVSIHLDGGATMTRLRWVAVAVILSATLLTAADPPKDTNAASFTR